MRDNSSEEGLGEVSNVGVEVIRVAADSQPLDGQGKEAGVFDRWGKAAREKEVFLDVAGFDVDGDEYDLSADQQPETWLGRRRCAKWIGQDDCHWGIQVTGTIGPEGEELVGRP